MEYAAILHRPDSEYAYTSDEHHLKLRCRTKKNDLAKVEVIYGDPYAVVAGKFQYHVTLMTPGVQTQQHDYWLATLEAPYRRLQYLFRLTDHEGHSCVYGDQGFVLDNEESLQNLTYYFRMPYFHPVDQPVTPDWVKKTVWYQIFPERFANGNPDNDPTGTLTWNPEDHPTRTAFYGGDLQGVMDHLDDLQRLGINGLYFCPVFEAHSNHKYDTIDYFKVDPAFGDTELLTKVVHAAHQRGMHVMLDAVFNHLGAHSPQWQDVLAQGRASRYWSWFHLNQDTLTPYQSPLTTSATTVPYDTFAFEPSMPKLNTANPEVQRYLLRIARYWIETVDIDAWRLDVANEIDHHFWQHFADACHSLKPDFYILGEIWHSAASWLQGNEFSAIMNYQYTQLIKDHFLDHRLDAATLIAKLAEQRMLYRDDVNEVMFNVLDSHDTPRLLTLAHHHLELAQQALVFTFLQLGTPCVYYGTEMAMTGAADPDNRKPMEWHPDEQGQQMYQFMTTLIQHYHQAAACLATGALVMTLDHQLLHVQRSLGTQHLDVWFNTTQVPQLLPSFQNLGSSWQQGVQESHLNPAGFIWTEYQEPVIGNNDKRVAVIM